VDRASILMRPLDDLGFPGQSISICGHVWSEYDDDWMTPVGDKKSIQVRGGAGKVVAVIRGVPPAAGKHQPVKTVLMTEYIPTGRGEFREFRKERRQMGVAHLMCRVVFIALGEPAFVSFRPLYRDLDKGNTALWNLAYRPRLDSAHRRRAWEGDELFRRCWGEPAFRSKLGFTWHSVAGSPGR
jgi:hypothetical protein